MGLTGTDNRARRGPRDAVYATRTRPLSSSAHHARRFPRLSPGPSVADETVNHLPEETTNNRVTSRGRRLRGRYRRLRAACIDERPAGAGCDARRRGSSQGEGRRAVTIGDPRSGRARGGSPGKRKSLLQQCQGPADPPGARPLLLGVPRMEQGDGHAGGVLALGARQSAVRHRVLLRRDKTGIGMCFGDATDAHPLPSHFLRIRPTSFSLATFSLLFSRLTRARMRIPPQTRGSLSDRASHTPSAASWTRTTRRSSAISARTRRCYRYAGARGIS